MKMNRTKKRRIILLAVIAVIAVITVIFVHSSVRGESSTPNTEEREDLPASATKEQEKFSVPNTEARKIYTEWLKRNGDEKNVYVLAVDLTHDGEEEMVIVQHNEEELLWAEFVYTLNENKEPVLIESRTGGDSHVTGFFDLFLLKKDDGQYYLIYMDAGLWQGYGEYAIRIYDLTADGHRHIVDEMVIASGEDEPVSEEAWHNYWAEARRKLEGCMSLGTDSEYQGIQVDQSLLLEDPFAEARKRGEKLEREEDDTEGLLNSELSEGVYDVRIYADGIRQDESGTLVNVDILREETVPQSVIDSLKAGDKLSFKTTNVVVTQECSYPDNDPPYDKYFEVSCDGSADADDYVIRYNTLSEEWTLIGSDNRPVYYVSKSGILRIPTKAYVWDERTPMGIGINVYGEQEPANARESFESPNFYYLKNLKDYFDFYHTDTEYVRLFVKREGVTALRIYYRP